MNGEFYTVHLSLPFTQAPQPSCEHALSKAVRYTAIALGFIGLLVSCLGASGAFALGRKVGVVGMATSLFVITTAAVLKVLKTERALIEEAIRDEDIESLYRLSQEATFLPKDEERALQLAVKKDHQELIGKLALSRTEGLKLAFSARNARLFKELCQDLDTPIRRALLEHFYGELSSENFDWFYAQLVHLLDPKDLQDDPEYYLTRVVDPNSYNEHSIKLLGFFISQGASPWSAMKVWQSQSDFFEKMHGEFYRRNLLHQLSFDKQGQAGLFIFLEYDSTQEQRCIDKPNRAGDTPLHCAIQQRDVEKISTLVHFGAKTTSINNCGFSPFQEAIARKQAQLLDVLFRNSVLTEKERADLIAFALKSGDLKTLACVVHACSLAVLERENTYVLASPFLAMKNGALLQPFCRSIESEWYFDTLFTAAMSGNCQALEHYLDAGVDPTLTLHGQLPLDYAAEVGTPEAAAVSAQVFKDKDKPPLYFSTQNN